MANEAMLQKRINAVEIQKGIFKRLRNARIPVTVYMMNRPDPICGVIKEFDVYTIVLVEATSQTENRLHVLLKHGIAEICVDFGAWEKMSAEEKQQETAVA